ETYTLIQSGNGNSKNNFTGRLTALKPHTLGDAVNMINNRLHRITGFAKKHNSAPVTFSLSQNYPNPFNPLTTIKYSLPKDLKVTIKIYDLLGREVNTLVNDFKKAGYYEVKFDGSNFASGVYFYRIEAGDFVQSKKM